MSDVDKMVEAVNDVVDHFKEKLSACEIVGILELIKADIIDEAKEGY